VAISTAGFSQYAALAHKARRRPAARLTIAKMIAVSAASSRTIAPLIVLVRRTSFGNRPSLRARCTRPMRASS